MSGGGKDLLTGKQCVLQKSTFPIIMSREYRLVVNIMI